MNCRGERVYVIENSWILTVVRLKAYIYDNEPTYTYRARDNEGTNEWNDNEGIQ